MTPDVSFLEIGSSSAAATGAFLEHLLGWAFHPLGAQGEALGAQGEGWFQGSTMQVGLHGNDPAPGFLVFFGVPDLEAAIENVVKLGGTAERPTEEPGFGRFCICKDPSGLTFGLHHRP